MFEGYISREVAKNAYGVIVGPKGEIDAAETRTLRADLKSRPDTKASGP